MTKAGYTPKGLNLILKLDVLCTIQIYRSNLEGENVQITNTATGLVY